VAESSAGLDGQLSKELPEYQGRLLALVLKMAVVGPVGAHV